MKKLHIYTITTDENEVRNIGLGFIKNKDGYTALEVSDWHTDAPELYREEIMFSQFKALGIEIVKQPLTPEVAEYILENSKRIHVSAANKTLHKYLYRDSSNDDKLFLLHLMAKKELKYRTSYLTLLLTKEDKIRLRILHDDKEIFNEILEDDCFIESSRLNSFLADYQFEYWNMKRASK